MQDEDSVETGTAGSSAMREYERRRKARIDRAHANAPRLAPILLKLIGEKQSTKAWKTGAIAEIKMGNAIDKSAQNRGWLVLHDRSIPGSRANIDHIVVTKRAVYVIDTKNYTGMVRIDEVGSLFTGIRSVLKVGNRDQTKLVDAAKRQASLVEEHLKRAGLTSEVKPALAFYKADWPLLFKAKEIDGVLINGHGLELTIREYDSKIKTDINQQEILTFLAKTFKSK